MPTTSVEDALRRVPLFRPLTPVQIGEMGRRLRRRHYDRGEIIFHQGDPGDTCYVLVQGQVKISLISPDGQEAILVMLDGGQCFGELALFDEQPRSASVTATEPSEVLVLQRPDFLRILATHPDIATSLLEIMTKRLRDTDQIVEDAAFLDVSERLAKKLLQLADSVGQPSDRGIEIGGRLTQQDLAAMIGATRESVNKQLGSLREDGIVRVDRQRITILDPDSLRRRVQFI